MRNFWANFTDFEPEINIMKCKTEKQQNLNILIQDCSLCLGKAILMQKFGKGVLKVVKSLGKNFNEFIIWANSH